MELLQREIAMLKDELDNLRLGVTEPVLKENAQLRKQLTEYEQAKVELQFRIDALNAEVGRHKKEKQRMEEKMTSVHKYNTGLMAQVGCWALGDILKTKICCSACTLYVALRLNQSSLFPPSSSMDLSHPPCRVP